MLTRANRAKISKLKWAYAISAGILLFGSSPASATKVWSCEYANFREPGKRQSLYSIQGDKVVEATGDVLWDYKLLENSDSLLMAERSGYYGRSPDTVRFLVTIDKSTGKFLLTMSSTGTINGKLAGNCKWVDLRPGY